MLYVLYVWPSSTYGTCYMYRYSMLRTYISCWCTYVEYLVHHTTPVMGSSQTWKPTSPTGLHCWLHALPEIFSAPHAGLCKSLQQAKGKNSKGVGRGDTECTRSATAVLSLYRSHPISLFLSLPPSLSLSLSLPLSLSPHLSADLPCTLLDTHTHTHTHTHSLSPFSKQERGQEEK